MDEDDLCMVCGWTCKMFTGSADLLAVLSHRSHAQYDMYFPVASRIVEIHHKASFTNETDVLKHLANFPSPFLCANCCFYLTDFMNAEQMVANAKTVLEERMQQTFALLSRAPKRSIPSDAPRYATPSKKNRCALSQTRRILPPVPLFSESSAAPPKADPVLSSPPDRSNRAETPSGEGGVMPDGESRRLAVAKRKRKKGATSLTCQSPSCGRMFKNSSNFFIHVAKYHRKDVSRVCPLCAQLAGSKKELQRHLYMKHPTKRHVEWLCCSHCPAMFQDKAPLSRHLHLFQHKAAPKRLSLAKILLKALPTRKERQPTGEEGQEQREGACPVADGDHQRVAEAAVEAAPNETEFESRAPETRSDSTGSERDLVYSKLQPVVKVHRLAMENLVATPEGGYVLTPAAPLLPVSPATPKDLSVSETEGSASDEVPGMAEGTALIGFEEEEEEEVIFDEVGGDEEEELTALVSEAGTESTSPYGRLLKCPVDDCDCAYSSVNYLNVHLMKRHQKTVRHMCPFCVQIFDTGEAMDRHILANHTTENPYRFKCNDCAGVFRDKHKLWKHAERFKHQEAPEGVERARSAVPGLESYGGVETSAASEEPWQPFVADGLETPALSSSELKTPSVIPNGTGVSHSTQKRKEIKDRLISYLESHASPPPVREEGDPLATPSSDSVGNRAVRVNGQDAQTPAREDSGKHRDTVPEIEGLALAVAEMGHSTVPPSVRPVHPVFVLHPITLGATGPRALTNGFVSLLAAPSVQTAETETRRSSTPSTAHIEDEISHVPLFYANGHEDSLSSVAAERSSRGTPPAVTSSTVSLAPPSVSVAKRKPSVPRKADERPSSPSMSIRTGRSSRASTPCFSEYDSDDNYTPSAAKPRVRRKSADLFPCPRCDQTRPHFNTLNTHILDKHQEIVHMCRLCRTVFDVRTEFDDHVRECHLETLKSGFRCLSCPGHYSSKSDLLRHLVRYRHENPDYMPSPQK